MKIPYISATRLERYEKCPLSYYFTYEDHGIPLPEEDTDNLKFGTIIHNMMEIFWTREYNEIPGNNDEEKLLSIYEELWQSSDLGRYDYYLLGKDMIPRLAQELPYDKIKPKIIAVEHPFDINISDSDGEQILLRGRIDLALREDDNTIHIIDYKTSAYTKTTNEAEYDTQLHMYHVVARELWPEFENVKLTLWFLRDRPVTVQFSQKQAEEFREYLIDMYYQIQANDNPQARINRFCAWCPAHHGACEAYRNFVTQPTFQKIDVSEADAEQLIEEYTRVAELEKVLEGRKEELKQIFQTILEATGKKELRFGDVELFLQSNSYMNYDPKVLRKYLTEEQFLELVSIPKSKVDKLLKKNPEALEELKRTASQVVSSSYIKTRKIKK